MRRKHLQQHVAIQVPVLQVHVGDIQLSRKAHVASSQTLHTDSSPITLVNKTMEDKLPPLALTDRRLSV